MTAYHHVDGRVDRLRRRHRLLRGVLLALVLLPATPAADPPNAFLAVLPPNPVILFQGDSITDGNRGRNQDPNHILGHGYQFIIAAETAAHEPERGAQFLNRGVSGNTVGDLGKRWQDDVIALKPDLLSVLIGINDFTHVVDGRDAGTALEYERAYDVLLATTRQALPHVRFVLGEPFLLPVGKREADYRTLKAGLRPYQEAVERLAAKYDAPVVHYQRLFDTACARAPASYWIWDGVHPTYAGHGLMATEWTNTVNAFYQAKHP